MTEFSRSSDQRWLWVLTCVGIIESNGGEFEFGLGFKKRWKFGPNTCWRSYSLEIAPISVCSFISGRRAMSLNYHGDPTCSCQTLESVLDLKFLKVLDHGLTITISMLFFTSYLWWWWLRFLFQKLKEKYWQLERKDDQSREKIADLEARLLCLTEGRARVEEENESLDKMVQDQQRIIKLALARIFPRRGQEVFCQVAKTLTKPQHSHNLNFTPPITHPAPAHWPGMTTWQEMY